MVILIDTREQEPLEFEVGGLISEVRSVGLPFGDYRAEYLDGSKSDVVFERKSIADLYGTMTAGHRRFMKEVKRAKDAGTRLVIAVEGTIDEVAEGYEYSEFKGESMLKMLGTLMFKHGIPTMFNPSRADMVRMMTWVFESEGYHRARTAPLRSAEKHLDESGGNVVGDKPTVAV